jgi:membrane protein
MNIFFLFIYMFIGLFAARQLQIGLFRNARESGAKAAPLRSKKFHRLIIVMVFLFTGLPYLVARFIPGSQWFSAVVYCVGITILTYILAISPSQPQLGWSMVSYAAATALSSYFAYSPARSGFSSLVLAVIACCLLIVGILHFLRGKAVEDEDEDEDIETAANSAMLEAAKAVITPSRVLTVILIVACLVAGNFLLKQLGIM